MINAFLCCTPLDRTICSTYLIRTYFPCFFLTIYSFENVGVLLLGNATSHTLSMITARPVGNALALLSAAGGLQHWRLQRQVSMFPSAGAPQLQASEGNKLRRILLSYSAKKFRIASLFCDYWHTLLRTSPVSLVLQLLWSHAGWVVGYGKPDFWWSNPGHLVFQVTDLQKLEHQL